MTVERIHDEGQTLDTPTGKLLGIVDTREELKALTQALESAGFHKIEVLSGEEGVQLLERVDTLFFSDMEDRVLTGFIEELKNDHFVILIETAANDVDKVVQIASDHGGRRLVHFGLLTVTWLKK
ncbi:MAG TPA: hypothetical protein VLA12_09440 [Planctomycetaceae bacterium]|nr:hypothetical protein [Planctomycetaceae bacterium]